MKDFEIEMEERLKKIYDNLGGHSGGHWEPDGSKPKLTNDFVTPVKKEPIIYIEEEVKILFDKFRIFKNENINLSIYDVEQWFDQNKKK